MQNELFEINFLNQRNPTWLEPVLLQNTGIGGPSACKYILTGDQFEMNFANIARPHYDIWDNKYRNYGNSFTTESYIPGPLVELGFSLDNNGTMDLKDIGSANLNRLQYFLTALPFVESRVNINQNLNGSTLDFYFKIDYLERICKFFPEILSPLINDFYKGKPHNLHGFFPYATNDIANKLEDISKYIYPKKIIPFDSIIMDQKAKSLLFQVLSRRKKMAFPKLSRQKQNDLLEIGEMVKTNPDRLIHTDDMAKEINSNVTTFKKAYNEFFNESPFHALHKGVMAKALVLLAKDTLSITEIAYELNYADVHQFCKVFKAFYNCSPSNYFKK